MQRNEEMLDFKLITRKIKYFCISFYKLFKLQGSEAEMRADFVVVSIILNSKRLVRIYLFKTLIWLFRNHKYLLRIEINGYKLIFGVFFIFLCKPLLSTIFISEIEVQHSFSLSLSLSMQFTKNDRNILIAVSQSREMSTRRVNIYSSEW